MTKKQKIKSIGVAVLLAGAWQASGQSSDALIDKLVQKGILTVKEGNELREEADKNFNTAYSVKSGMPDWVTALKFNGDLRGRFEGFYSDNPVFVSRNRYRYRLRFGVTANITDNMEVGLRLSSSEPASGGVNGGDPISGNTTLQDNGSRKFIYLDLAYGKWTPINRPDWTTTFIIGKMENPFVFSDMVFDGDYTPEGAAMQIAYNFNDKHAIKFNAGAFSVDEVSASGRDPFWYGGQLRWEAAWNKKVQTSVGIAGLVLNHEEFLNATRSSTLGPGPGGSVTNSTTTWTVPNQNGGNLRSPVSGLSGAAGNLLNHYNPIVADASFTYTLDKFWHYSVPFPIRVAGDYIYNPAASSQNRGYSAGITFGKSGKRGLWDVSYRYKYLEGDAWYEELVDSDFGAFYQAGSARSSGGSGYIAGTNIKGHIIKASYSPFDSWTLGVTAFITDLIQKSPSGSDSGMTRLQVDANWKF